MYAKLSGEFLSTRGYLKIGAADKYIEKADVYQFPKKELQESVVELCKELLGEKIAVENIQKSRWTGLSRDSHVFKVQIEKKIAFLKCYEKFEHQISTILFDDYLKDNPIKGLATPKILKHGAIEYGAGKRLFFTVYPEAKGSDMFSSLREERAEKFIEFVRHVGKLIAVQQNTSAEKLTPYEKFLVSTRINDELLDEALHQPSKTGMDVEDKFMRRLAEEIIPEVHKSSIEYMNGGPNKSLALPLYKLSNLTFDREKEVLTVFDTTKFFPFTGPKMKPEWGSELNFCSFLHHIRFLGAHFDLSESRIDKAEEAFLSSFHENCKRHSMTPEGVYFFTTQAYLRTVTNFMRDTFFEDRFAPKTEKMIQEFLRFKEKRKAAIKKILNM